jgi:hypothetical protein
MMSDFAAQRQVKEYTYRLQASPAEVFPLLCPVREYDWIDGWSCEPIYSDSGIAENNCVFKTHFPEIGEAIWTVSKYDPNGFIIEFAIVYPGLFVEKLDVSLKADGDKQTTIRWARTYTGLSPQGNTVIEHIAKEFLDERTRWINESLNHYLTTGSMLRRG